MIRSDYELIRDEIARGPRRGLRGHVPAWLTPRDILIAILGIAVLIMVTVGRHPGVCI